MPEVESTKSWISGNGKGMPESMRKEISAGVHEAMFRTDQKSVNMHFLIKLVGAACIALFLLFSYEQFKTIQKINRLEVRIAKESNDKPVQFRAPDELLFINTFLSWSEIAALRVQPLDPIDENNLLPSYLRTNFFGDQELKKEFSKYLRELQLVTKLYLP